MMRMCYSKMDTVLPVGKLFWHTASDPKLDMARQRSYQGLHGGRKTLGARLQAIMQLREEGKACECG